MVTTNDTTDYVYSVNSEFTKKEKKILVIIFSQCRHQTKYTETQL